MNKLVDSDQGIKKLPILFDKILFFILAIAVFLPTESYSIILIFAITFLRFLLIFWHSRKVNIVEFNLIILALYLVSNSFFFFLKGGSIFPFLTYCLTGGYVFFLLFGARRTSKDVLNFFYNTFKFITITQLPIIFIEGFKRGFARGDWYGGITGNSHYLGLFFLIVFFEQLINYNSGGHLKVFKILLLIALIFAIWLCDINTFMVCFLASAIIAYLLIKRKVTIISLILVFSIGFFSWFFSTYGTLFEKDNISRIPKVAGFLTLSDLFNSESSILIYGTSLGTYSSRAAVSLSSSNVLAKPRGNALPIVYTSEYISEYFAQLYSPEYYESLEKAGVTGTFYTPFSTVLSIIGEYGLIGTSLVLLITLSLIKKLYLLARIDYKKPLLGLLIMFGILFSFLYDNFLEYPVMITPAIVIVMSALDINNK